MPTYFLRCLGAAVVCLLTPSLALAGGLVTLTTHGAVPTTASPVRRPAVQLAPVRLDRRTLDLRWAGELTARDHRTGRLLWRLQAAPLPDHVQPLAGRLLVLSSSLSGALMGGEIDVLVGESGRPVARWAGVLQFVGRTTLVSQNSASLYLQFAAEPVYTLFDAAQLRTKTLALSLHARKQCAAPADPRGSDLRTETVQSHVWAEHVTYSDQAITLHLQDGCGRFVQTYRWASLPFGPVRPPQRQ